MRREVHSPSIQMVERAKSTALARWHWQQQYSLPSTVAFHRNIAAYFMKDDHDTLCNDCWPGQRYGALTWEQGLAIFTEQVPIGPMPYRTFRWGRDLQVWLVEGRDFRSPNTLRVGPEESIWGPDQIAFPKVFPAGSIDFAGILITYNYLAAFALASTLSISGY